EAIAAREAEPEADALFGAEAAPEAVFEEPAAEEPAEIPPVVVEDEPVEAAAEAGAPEADEAEEEEPELAAAAMDTADQPGEAETEMVTRSFSPNGTDARAKTAVERAAPPPPPDPETPAGPPLHAALIAQIQTLLAGAAARVGLKTKEGLPGKPKNK